MADKMYFSRPLGVIHANWTHSDPFVDFHAYYWHHRIGLLKIMINFALEKLTKH